MQKVEDVPSDWSRHMSTWLWCCLIYNHCPHKPKCKRSHCCICLYKKVLINGIYKELLPPWKVALLSCVLHMLGMIPTVFLIFKWLFDQEFGCSGPHHGFFASWFSGWNSPKKVAYPKNHGISKFWWELEIQQKSLQQKTSKPPLFGQEKPVILRVNMCHVCHPSFMSKLASWKGATGQRPARPKNIQSILRIWWLGGGEESARFPK